MCWPCGKTCCPSNKSEHCGCDRCPNPNCWSDEFYWNWEQVGCPDPVLYIAEQRELFDEQRELFDGLRGSDTPVPAMPKLPEADPLRQAPPDGGAHATRRE